MRTAAQSGTLEVIGETILLITIGDRQIEDEALVSPNLTQELIVGAGTIRRLARVGRRRLECNHAANLAGAAGQDELHCRHSNF